MISVRKILTQWCAAELPKFKFDTVELLTMPPDRPLDQLSIQIEHGNFVASFTAWGWAGTTEWIVGDIRKGDTTIVRDEKFSDEKQLIALVEKAMVDLRQ